MTQQVAIPNPIKFSTSTIPTSELQTARIALLPQVNPLEVGIDSRLGNVTTLIVKVTHRCNLDCLYCYEYIAKGDDMPLSVFKTLADKTLLSTKQKRLTFLFHGGEPTLLSEQWFSEAVHYARSRADLLGKKALFSIQTNLVGLDEKKLHLFSNLGVAVSASLDGFSSLANPMRQRAEAAIQKYKHATTLGIKIGVLMTINHANFNKFAEICRWLENDLHTQEFKANVVSSVGRGLDLPELSPEQIFQAYHDILEYMIESKGQGAIEDNLTLELIRFFASPEERSQMPTEMCRSRHCGAGNSVIGVTPEGNLLPCGRFQWDEELYFLGSIDDSDRANMRLAYGQAVEKFHALVPENWYDCSSCKASRVCSFGCQAFAVRSKKKANIDCFPTKMRFDYYEQNARRLNPIVALLKHRFNKRNSALEEVVGYNDGSYSDSYNDSTYSDYSDRS